jgi:hypothetical protein
MLLALSFGFGYLWGKQPANNLEQTVRDFSRNVVDTTLGIERDLHRRQSLVDAKSNVVQAKADFTTKIQPMRQRNWRTLSIHSS